MFGATYHQIGKTLNIVLYAPGFIGTFAIFGRADGSRISKVERECLSIQFKSARMYGAFG